MALWRSASERRAQFDEKNQELADKAQAKLRAKAAKRGIGEGAVALAYDFRDGSEQWLIVWPDRVEVRTEGKMGSLLKRGAGSQVIAAEKISSVEERRDGLMYSVVTIHTSGTEIAFRTDVAAGPVCHAAILEITAGARPTSNQPAAASPTDALRQLAELHAAGILTDDEYAAKKQELLDRL